MIKQLARIGVEHPTLGKGMSALWRVAQTVPGRYRAAFLLEKVAGFLSVREDGIYRGKERIPVHPRVCMDLLQHGILQLRAKEKAGFEEWLAFLKDKQPTNKIGINMAIAPEVVRIWNPAVKGKGTLFDRGGTFTIEQQMPIFLSPLFNVRKDVVTLPNGVTTDWLMIDAPGAVEIVPVTDDGKIKLIKQPRHAAPIGWEVPAGVLEKGVAPEKQAAIELEEEAGFTAGEIIHLCDYYIFVGSSNQVMRAHLARGLTFVGQKQEEQESIGDVKDFTQEEIWEMIDQGSIRDSHTIVAVLLAMRYLNKKCPDAHY